MMFSIFKKKEFQAYEEIPGRSAPSPDRMDKSLREGPTRWSEYHQCWLGEKMDLFAWLSDPESYYGDKFSGPNALSIYNHECDKEHAGLIPRHHTKYQKQFDKENKRQEERLSRRGVS